MGADGSVETELNTGTLPPAVADYLANDRGELFDFVEALVGFDTRNPPGCTGQSIAWLESTLDRPGINVERSAVDPEKPNPLATIEGDGALFYDCGTTDMKGPVAAMA